jgi:hypothetical protein
MTALDPGNVRPLDPQNFTVHSGRAVAIRVECPDDTDSVAAKPLNESLGTNGGARGSPEKGGGEE